MKTSSLKTKHFGLGNERAFDMVFNLDLVASRELSRLPCLRCVC